MKHLLTVFLYELHRGLRRKGYLFATFGLPLMLIAIGAIVIAATGLNDPEAALARSSEQINAVVEQFVPDAGMRYGLVDASGLLAEAELPEGYILYPDEAAARAGLDAGAISAYYLIPADYLDSGKVTITLPELQISAISSQPAAHVLGRALAERAVSGGADDAIILRLQDPSNYQITNLALRVPTTVSESESEGFGANFIVIYVFALILLLSLFVTNGYLLQSVIEEKETRLIEILIASVRPFHLIAGKIAAYGVLGLLQIVIWIGFALAVLRISGGESLQRVASVFAALAQITLPLELLLLLIVYFVLGYLMFAGLYGVVGAISNSMKEGPQYAVIFTLPAVTPLYFLVMFAEQPDAPLPMILSLFPLTSPLAMTQRLIISPVPGWQILLSLGLLLLAVAGTTWLAGRAFRVQTLLAGSPPRLRDLPK
ncbi:MAG: ABC transporter permease, partial [Anaerolinea sp.]|nr:ABC transporter permease [Anaerolinea sp.]